ncbi:MAG TPA: outer membrane lipoprotein-sorting protein [Chryseosolibacter sp.]|nr:outer membrane lipoprotein-sorting protein [Chryseosolibacter sp.]
MIRRFTLTLLAVLTVFATQAQTADEILAKYFENTGGLTKWKEIKTTKMEGKAPTPQGDFPIVLYAKAPNKSKVVLNVQGKELIAQAYDGTTAWTLNPFAGGTTAVKLDEEQAKEVKEEEVESEFIDYAKKGHAVTLEGKEEIDGVQCYKIKIEKHKNNDKEDVVKVYYFDSENYVPIMVKSYVRSGPAKGTEMQTYLSDYQDVSGLMMPFAMETKINGQVVQKLVVEKIVINENIDDSVFAYPSK